MEKMMTSRIGTTTKEALENMLARLEAEFEIIDTILSPEEVETFKAYYKAMPYTKLPPQRRLSTYRRFYRGYLSYIVSSLLSWQGERPPVVLDAGSGLGTQSRLFALLGADVHGVDLRQDRVVIAQKRAQYWGEQFGCDLSVKFSCESLFGLPKDGRYDFIWICQAISHIDPAEDFLDLTYELVKPGGQVIVFDPNGMYVPHQFHQLRNRGTCIHRTYTTHTGEVVPYAMERLLTYGGIQRLLRRSGFQIAHKECQFHKFRGKPDDRQFERYLRPFDFLPIVTSFLGYEYIVAGRKPITSGSGGGQ